MTIAPAIGTGHRGGQSCGIRSSDIGNAGVDVDLPLESLVATHVLDDFEKNVLLLALAPTVDPQFDVVLEELFACHCMEVRSVLQILCDDLQHKVRARRYFTCHGALISNGLLNLSFRRHAATDNEFMRIDAELPRRISSLILESPDVDEQLITFSSVIDPEVDLASVVLPEGDKTAALEQVRRHADFCQRRAEWGFDDILSYGKGIVMLFAGLPEWARRCWPTPWPRRSTSA